LALFGLAAVWATLPNFFSKSSGHPDCNDVDFSFPFFACKQLVGMAHFLALNTELHLVTD
jgi:hypothetical protein